jgi:hypothetical protein
MSSFAAVEIRAGEHENQSIRAFFTHAEGIGLKFDALEPYGPLSIGSTMFLRFTTDCRDLDKLVPFFQEEPRALILPGKAGYRMITQTTEGPIPIVCVQAARLPGYNRRWRGTSNKFWARQFSS